MLASTNACKLVTIGYIITNDAKVVDIHHIFLNFDDHEIGLIMLIDFEKYAENG